MKRFLLFLLYIIYIYNSSARTWVVAPWGTLHGEGTFDSPLDIISALGRIESGDSLLLRGGTYLLQEGLYLKPNGTDERRTFMGAYLKAGKAEKPILDFRNQPHFKNGLTMQGNYQHIKNISICYAGYKGIINTGSYNILDSLDVYGNCDSGIQMKGGHSNVIIDCDSHDNFDYMTGTLQAADWGGNADGFADKQYKNSPGNTYIRCKAWNNSDDGWDFFQREGGKTMMQDCICYQNGPQEYDLSNHPRRLTDREFLDQFEGEGISVTLKNNKQVLCSLTHFYNNGNGNGFKLGGKSTHHDVELTNCLSHHNAVKGFDQNSNAGIMTLSHCKAHHNGKNYGFYNDNGYTLYLIECSSLDGVTPDTFTGKNIFRSPDSHQGTE